MDKKEEKLFIQKLEKMGEIKVREVIADLLISPSFNQTEKLRAQSWLQEKALQKQKHLAIIALRISGLAVVVAFIIPLIGTFISWREANEANNIARNVSNVTNRPYILLKSIRARHLDINNYTEHGKEKRLLPIEYGFYIVNDGRLPAWVIDINIFFIGKNRAIKALYGPKDWPTENFAVGCNGGYVEIRHAESKLKEYIDENAGDVAEFDSAINKMMLMLVKYKTMGNDSDKNIFTQWELVKFTQKYDETITIKCGNSGLGESDIVELFKKQEEKFEKNEVS